jgi:hypothetical protein
MVSKYCCTGCALNSGCWAENRGAQDMYTKFWHCTMYNWCWSYFTHLGFIFPKVILCLLVIISHYLVSYILGRIFHLENILFQLTL